MELKSCRVTVRDMEGVAHTVEVTASTLYEAVALGLKQIRGNEWVEQMPDAFDTVKVSVKSVAVEHTVKMGEFTAWVKRNGAKSPAEMMRRRKIREILEMPL
jgi:hypothetical protein